MARERADAPGLAMAAGAGLIATSLFAPWAHWWHGTREMVLGFEVNRIDGWDRLDGGRAIAVAGVVALLAALAAWRLSGRPLPRAARSLGALTVVGVGAWVALTTPFGVEARTPDPAQFSIAEPSLREGPLVAAIGALLALGGVAAARLAPARRLTGRGLALLLCGGALLAAMHPRWTSPGDAWDVYPWADAGLALIAVLLVFAAMLPRHPALVVLPLAAIALPFADLGIHPSFPGGFAEPVGMEGSAVGAGAILALAAVLLALVTLAGRPTGRLSGLVSRGPSSRRSRPRRRGRRSAPSPSSGSAP